MYVNPFVLGVLVTLFSELAILFIGLTINLMKNNK